MNLVARLRAKHATKSKLVAVAQEFSRGTGTTDAPRAAYQKDVSGDAVNATGPKADRSPVYSGSELVTFDRLIPTGNYAESIETSEQAANGESNRQLDLTSIAAVIDEKINDSEKRSFNLKAAGLSTLEKISKDKEQKCKTCKNVTKFGNCSTPQAATLSTRFVLISHPMKGAGCQAFTERLDWLTEDTLRTVESALAVGAIDADDAAVARAAILAANLDDPLIDEWRELLRYCVLSTVEKGLGVSDAVKPLLVSSERALRMNPMPR